MKDNKKLKIALIIISIVVVNLLIFCTIRLYTASRIINIIFLNFSIFVVEFFTLFNTKDNENKFLNYSKYPIVIRYFSLTSTLSMGLLLYNPYSVFLTLIPQILTTGRFLILMLMNEMADNATEKSLKKTKVKIDKTRAFSDKLDIILKNIEDRDLYKKVEKVYDASRSLKVNIKSDSTEIDNQILNDISQLEKYVQENNIQEIDNTLNEINKKFILRNSL